MLHVVLMVHFELALGLDSCDMQLACARQRAGSGDRAAHDAAAATSGAHSAFAHHATHAHVATVSLGETATPLSKHTQHSTQRLHSSAARTKQRERRKDGPHGVHL